MSLNELHLKLILLQSKTLVTLSQNILLTFPVDNSPIAFTVAHAEGKVYNPEARIEFPTIITNEGGGYITGLNEFWCPVDGLYYFSHFSVGLASNSASTEIWMDDTYLVTSLTSGGTTPATGNSVVVHCNSGSKVYVQCGPAPCTQQGTTNNYQNSVTFLGFLLTSDDTYLVM